MTKNKTHKTIRLGTNLFSVSGSKNRKCSIINSKNIYSINYRNYSGTYEISMSHSGKFNMHRSYSGMIENAIGSSASGSRNWGAI